MGLRHQNRMGGQGASFLLYLGGTHGLALGQYHFIPRSLQRDHHGGGLSRFNLRELPEQICLIMCKLQVTTDPGVSS